MEKLLTVEEVAERLRVTPFAVREYLKAGKLRGFKVGKSWRVEEPELERFIEDLKRQSE